MKPKNHAVITIREEKNQRRKGPVTDPGPKALPNIPTKGAILKKEGGKDLPNRKLITMINMERGRRKAKNGGMVR